MKQHLCRIISVIISVVMLIFTVNANSPVISMKSQATSKPTSGKWKENVSWNYNTKTKVLTVTGTGLMQDAGNDTGDNPKWLIWRDEVKKVEIKGTLKYIGASAFNDFSKLESVEMCDSVTTIGGCAFDACKQLKTVKFSKNLKKIGESAFWLSGIRNVSFPNKLEYIGNHAFSFTNIKEVKIPDSVTTIKPYAFAACKKLKRITLPNNLSAIENGVFGVTDIRKITIPKNVTEIGESAFSYCSKLKTIEIKSKKIKDIEENAFCEVSLNANFKVPVKKKDYYQKLLLKSGIARQCKINGKTLDAKKYKDEDNSTITWNLDEDNYILTISGQGEMKDFKNLIEQEEYENDEEGVYQYVEKIIIEEGITSIGANAFNDKTYLTSISLPSTLTSIGDNAFYNCEALKKINIPESVTYIGEGAFAYTGLKEITIPSQTTKISNYCFAGCKKLKQVTLPETTEAIQWGAFWRCKKLKNITLPAALKELEDYSFYESGIANLPTGEGVTRGKHLLK